MIKRQRSHPICSSARLQNDQTREKDLPDQGQRDLWMPDLGLRIGGYTNRERPRVRRWVISALKTDRQSLRTCDLVKVRVHIIDALLDL